MPAETCENCGRRLGTEEQLETASYDEDPGVCFSAVLFDGDEDPHCQRIELMRLRRENTSLKQMILDFTARFGE